MLMRKGDFLIDAMINLYVKWALTAFITILSPIVRGCAFKENCYQKIFAFFVYVAHESFVHFVNVMYTFFHLA